MKIVLVLTLFIASVTAAIAEPPAKQPDKNNDKVLIQGEWLVASLEINGEQNDDFKGRKLVIKGDEWNEGGKRPLSGEEFKYKLTLDTTKIPKHIDLTIKLRGNDETKLGIYKLEGDTLTLCQSPGERPTEFKGDSGNSLVVYKRAANK